MLPFRTPCSPRLLAQLRGEGGRRDGGSSGKANWGIYTPNVNVCGIVLPVQVEAFNSGLESTDSPEMRVCICNVAEII